MPPKYAIRTDANQRDVVEVSANVRVCGSCGELKPIELFCASKLSKDGFTTTCRECNKKRSKKWREANREQFLKNMRDWYQRNKESALSASRKWAEENRDLMRKYGREWARRNPEYMLLQVHKRRARLNAVGGSLSVGLAKKLLVLQKGKCACCGKKLNGKYHMDHIVPLALGGANVDSNIQLLSPTCNISKSAKDPVDYMQSKGYLL